MEFASIAVLVALLIISKDAVPASKHWFYSKKEAFSLSAVSKNFFSSFFMLLCSVQKGFAQQWTELPEQSLCSDPALPAVGIPIIKNPFPSHRLEGRKWLGWFVWGFFFAGWFVFPLWDQGLRKEEGDGVGGSRLKGNYFCNRIKTWNTLNRFLIQTGSALAFKGLLLSFQDCNVI